jgi:hypothetical protein
MPWIDPHLAAIAAFFREEVMRFLLQTTLAYPYSASLFMTDNEEGLYFSIANFAFHRNHFGDSPISSILILPPNCRALWTSISSYFDI